MMLHDEDWNPLAGQALSDAEAAVAAGTRLMIATGRGRRLMSAAEEAATRAEWAENTPTLDALRQRAHDAIDAAAGAARARYITTVAGQEATYLLKESQARGYRAAGYPADFAAWPMVAAEARARNGQTATPTAAQAAAAADLMITTADAWIGLAAEIERLRMGHKTAVSAAADAEAIDAEVAAATAALRAV